MIRTIRLNVDKPVIPEDATLEHSATSWHVSLIPNFDNDDTLIVKQDKDEDNKLQYEFTYDLAEDQPLYIRSKYHFKDGDDEYEDNWSKIIPLNVRDTGIKMSSVMIVTPTVTVKPTYDDVTTGELLITSSDYLLYAGTGSHKATSYLIETIDGTEVFRRDMDEDNLTELKIDLSVIKREVLHIVKVKYHSTTNADSNWGRAVLKLTSEANHLYSIKRISELKPYREMYFKLNVLTTDIKSVDIEIRDYKDTVVASIYDEVSNIIKVKVDDIPTNRYYNVYTRVKYHNGLISPFTKLEEVFCVDNYLVNLNPTIGYRNNFNLIREFNTNSLTVNFTYELTNGNTLFMKHNDDNIYLYKNPKSTDIEYSRSIYKLGDEFKGKPYFHARELPSGKVIVDVVDKYLTPTFIIFDYNPVTDTFEVISKITREDERFNTAVSGSLISFKNDSIVYIPARQLDGNKYTKLQLKSIDIENNTVKVIKDLPVDVVAFANLFMIKDTAYMMFGSDEYELDDNKERIFKRKHNKLYKYDYENNEFNNAGDINNMPSNKLYSVHPVVRKDGKVVLFNSVFTGDYLGNQDTLLLDVNKKDIKSFRSDTADILSYRNTIVTKLGNIFRITSRVRDSQKIYLYEVDNGSDKEIKDDKTLDKITNLVIPKKKVITIESPHRFETITVDGSNYDDTGTLRLIIDGVLKEVKYRDLLIYKDTHWEINLYEGDHDNWDNVYILDNAKFEINYFIDIPDNETLTIKAPFAVEYIHLGEDAELIVEDED